MVQPLLDPFSIWKNDYQVAVWALDSKSLDCAKTCPCMGRTTTFRTNGWALRDVTSFSCILQSVSVDQSGGLSTEIGVLYLSHAMLVLAELNACSTRGFACILAKWLRPTVMSLPLTCRSPEASCNKRGDTYFRGRTASLMKEFWTLCVLLMTDSKTVILEIIPYSNIGLTHCL